MSQLGIRTVLLVLWVGAAGVGEPEGYHRVAYDNCGVIGKQAHLQQGSNYTYPLQDIPAEAVPAGDPARTAAFHTTQVVLVYQGLSADAQYKLDLRLLSDQPRIESIFCGDRVIKRGLALEKGRICTLLFDVPEDAYAHGRLALSIRREDGPNAVVSEVTLYSTARSLKPVLRMSAFGTLDRTIRGGIRDLNNEAPVAAVPVKVSVPQTDLQMSTRTDQAGAFSLIIPKDWQGQAGEGLTVRAVCGTDQLEQVIDSIELFAPRLIPRPTQSHGVKTPLLMLNGRWKFSPTPPADFPLRTDLVQQFTDINVPGEWVMQGFDVPKGQAAGYFRRFQIPGDFAGQRIILHCDAVYAQAEVWMNGQRAGAHAGGMTPFQLDVTKWARPGRENWLALKVLNDAQADVLASGSQYAVHVLGGITRKLYLFALPPCAMTGYDLVTTFDAAYRDADIEVSLALENRDTQTSEPMQVRFSLYDGTGKSVALSKNQIELGQVLAGQDRHWQIHLPVTQPRQWDAEHPNLYVLECELRAGARPAEVVRRRFGFRQIEIRGDQVLVNNHPIKLHGVDRHEVDPLRGRSLTPPLWHRDAELFRDANVNYIRTSHYPPAEEFLDACDELGLFVECEAPLCWVQHGANANWGRPGWDYLDRGLYTPLLRANLENVAFNRNHPSILIWSLANESRWSPLWARVLKAVETLDPTRATSFHDQCYGGYNSAGSTAQIANMHYPGPAGPQQTVLQKRPLLFGEYCHLNTYNRYELVTDPGLREAWGRGFKAMWDSIYAQPGCLGGAIWSGIDDTFHLPSGLSVGYGAWGPIDGWRRPKPEYFHVKKVYSPVHIDPARVLVPSQDGRLDIPLENRHDFTGLREVEIRWRIGQARGQARADVAPRHAGILHIQTGMTKLAGQTLELTFVSLRGFVIDTYHLPIGPVPHNTVQTVSHQERPALQLCDQGQTWGIQVGDIHYEIDQHSGQIVRAKLGDTVVLTGGPHLMILPLNSKGPTQMTAQAQDFAPFTDVCTDRTVQAVSAVARDDGIVIDVKDQYAQARGAYQLHMDRQGNMRIQYSYEALQAVNPRQWGLVLQVPRDLDTLTWQRRGLWTWYPADHLGRLQGRARAFTGQAICGPLGPRTRPDYPWALDNTAWGTNDFRSTKEHIITAQLLNQAEHGVTVLGHGQQHVRAWVADQKILWLIADYSNAGAERFFRSHARMEDRPLKPGNRIGGQIHLMLQ